MSLPAMLQIVPAAKTAKQTPEIAQAGFMGFGFPFVARATKASAQTMANNPPKTHPKYKPRCVMARERCRPKLSHADRRQAHKTSKSN